MDEPRRIRTRRECSRRPRMEDLEARLVMTFIPLASPVEVAGAAQAPSSRAIGEADNGNYAVVWDVAGAGLDTRVYNASGAALTSAIHVDSTGVNDSQAALAMDGAGQFVVAWMDSGSGGTANTVYAQRYNASGTAQGGAITVATELPWSQPSVSVDTAGDFVVVTGMDFRGTRSTQVSLYSAAGRSRSRFRSIPSTWVTPTSTPRAWR